MMSEEHLTMNWSHESSKLLEIIEHGARAQNGLHPSTGLVMAPWLHTRDFMTQ